MEILADKYNQPIDYHTYTDCYFDTIWKELIPFKDKIYFIYSGLHSNYCIVNKRTEESLLQQITDAYNSGYRHIIFDNVGEGLAPTVILKIHHVAQRAKELFTDIICAYMTGADDGTESYLNTCNHHNLTPALLILSCHFFEYHAKTNYVPKDIQQYVVENKPKYFSCLNRVIRPHRLELLERMLGESLVTDKCYYSFYDSSVNDGGVDRGIVGHGSYRFTNIKRNREFVDTLRLNFDEDRINPVDIREGDLTLYDDTYFSLIPETNYYEPNFYQLYFEASTAPNSNCIFFSEKVYKPIIMQHPFILVARPYSLLRLKSRGFKTFHPFINEHYDTIEHDLHRMALIVDEVKRLCNQTDEEWLEWCYNIRHIVEYNRDQLMRNQTYLVQKDLNKFLETF